ncbi:MAG TPA: ribonuclease domain-containing protein [Gallionella sp.]|jgi:ribonuclease T1|nr:ribonuclease domain-containing protein [Gallionella sp.]
MSNSGLRLGNRFFTLFAVLCALASTPAIAYASPSQGENAQQIVALAELPAEARATLRTIKQGGPFAYERDGVVFKNYERVLPIQPRSYYHEYTVKAPGAHNRGARRIVCGSPVECYYSADHYQTFKRIRE